MVRCFDIFNAKKVWKTIVVRENSRSGYMVNLIGAKTKYLAPVYVKTVMDMKTLLTTSIFMNGATSLMPSLRGEHPPPKINMKGLKDEFSLEFPVKSKKSLIASVPVHYKKDSRRSLSIIILA